MKVIKKIKCDCGDLQYDYNSLANIPTNLVTKEELGTMGGGSVSLQTIEPYLDGPWTAYSGTTPNLIGAVKYEVSSTRETVEIDLSPYLPNDGHDYEVLVGGEFTTGTELGSVFKMFVSSSIATAVVSLGRQITNVSSKGATGGGNAIIPIATDRKLFMKYNCTGSKSGNIYLTFNSYRRLGKPVEGV